MIHQNKRKFQSARTLQILDGPSTPGPQFCLPCGENPGDQNSQSCSSAWEGFPQRCQSGRECRAQRPSCSCSSPSASSGSLQTMFWELRSHWSHWDVPPCIPDGTLNWNLLLLPWPLCTSFSVPWPCTPSYASSNLPSGAPCNSSEPPCSPSRVLCLWSQLLSSISPAHRETP